MLISTKMSDLLKETLLKAMDNQKELLDLMDSSVTEHIRERKKRIALLYLYAMLSSNMSLFGAMEFFAIRIDSKKEWKDKSYSVNETLTLVPRTKPCKINKDDEENMRKEILNVIMELTDIQL